MGATDVGDELIVDGVSTGFGEYLLTEAVETKTIKLLLADKLC